MQVFRAKLVENRSSSPGFTRAELLVVLAIVWLATSLIPPGIQAAREQARRIQCKNNLRFIGLLTRESVARGTADMPGVVIEKSADSDITLLVAAIVAAFATLCASLGALFIRFTVQCVNRRGDRRNREAQDSELTGSLLECWFCPPSSSPI
jgi:hypothetical protein